MKQFNFKRGYYTTCFVEEKIVSFGETVEEAMEKIDKESPNIPYLGTNDEVFIASYEIDDVDTTIFPEDIEYIKEYKLL